MKEHCLQKNNFFFQFSVQTAVPASISWSRLPRFLWCWSLQVAWNTSQYLVSDENYTFINKSTPISSCVHQPVLFLISGHVYKAPGILESLLRLHLFIYYTFKGVSRVEKESHSYSACRFNKGFQLSLFRVFRPLCTSWLQDMFFQAWFVECAYSLWWTGC